MYAGLILLGFAVLVFVVGFGTAIGRALSVRIRKDHEIQLIAVDEIPQDILHILKKCAEELTALGFIEFGALIQPPEYEGVSEKSWSLIYRHAESQSYARLQLSHSPSSTFPCEVTFSTYGTDDQVIETVNYRAHLLPKNLPNYTLLDARSCSWTAQWNTHLAALGNEPSFHAIELTLHGLATRLASFAESANDYHLREKHYICAGDGSLRYSLRGASSAVLRHTCGERARGAALRRYEQKRARAGETSVSHGDPDHRSAVIAALAVHRAREEEEQSRKISWPKKLVFFAVSAVLFGIAFGIRLSPELVLILFGVLLFHELGHALAMRAFGYQNLQILFVPFLGALAAGKKREAKPYQEIIVFLAGPVPGIAAGLLIFLNGYNEISPAIGHTANALLFINYLNLLPIMPLDGGRVMNLLLFDRWPRLQLIFTGGSTALIALAAVLSGDFFLWIIVLAIAISLPGQHAQGRIVRAVRSRLAAGGVSYPPEESTLIRHIYEDLQKPRFAKWNRETKYQIASRLLSRLSHRPAGIITVTLALIFYLSCLTLPVGILAYSNVQRSSALAIQQEAKIQRRLSEWNNMIDAATDERVRARISFLAGKALADSSDVRHALPYLRRAARLLEGQGQFEIEASTYLILGRLSVSKNRDSDGLESGLSLGREYFNRALNIREIVFGTESLEVAEVLSEMSLLDEYDSDATQLRRWVRLLLIYEKVVGEDPSVLQDLVFACHNAARLEERVGNDAQAEAHYIEAAELAGQREGKAALSQGLMTLGALTDFYFSRSRFDDVRRVLRQREALLGKLDGGVATDYAPTIQLDHAWLAYWEKNFPESRLRFEKIRTDLKRGSGHASKHSEELHLLFSLAMVAERVGDEREASRLLEEASDIVEREWHEPLETYVSVQWASEEDQRGSFSAEYLRRQNEQARLLRKLVTQL